MPFDGRAYLEDLIAERFGARGDQPPAGREAAFNLIEVRGIAKGLVAAGALSAPDSDELFADLSATFLALGWEQTSRSFSSHSELTARATGRVRPDWRRRAEHPPAPELVRVIPLTGDAFDFASGRHLLLSVEVWSTFFNLRTATDRPLGRGIFSHMVLHPTDDLGNEYQPTTGGASGGLVVVSDHNFEPGLRPGASRLQFVAEGPEGDRTEFAVALTPPP